MLNTIINKYSVSQDSIDTIINILLNPKDYPSNHLNMFNNNLVADITTYLCNTLTRPNQNTRFIVSEYDPSDYIA